MKIFPKANLQVLFMRKSYFLCDSVCLQCIPLSSPRSSLAFHTLKSCVYYINLLFHGNRSSVIIVPYVVLSFKKK